MDVETGLTELTCSTWGLIDRQRLDLAAGQIRYFAISVQSGIYTPYCLVREVDPAVAQPQILQRTRVTPI